MSSTLSISNYGSTTKVVPAWTSSEGSLAMLHEIAWKGQNLNEVFHNHVVERDEVRADARTLENAVKLTWGDLSTPPELLAEFFGLSAILVREEYRNMLQDIIRFAYPTEQYGNGGMEIDMDVPSSVLNPFNTEALPIQRGVTVIGNPGIGKSVFLIYVLALRLLCRRTTVFQWKNARYYVLNNEGVFRVNEPIDVDVAEYIPKGTWFLIDSNQDLDDVPMDVPMLALGRRGFTLQAASPRTGRVQWQKKTKNVKKFWMSSWSIAELIAGRDLQWPQNMVTEVAIENFCKLYGTSARHVYDSAMDQRSHAKEVNGNIGKLSREKVIGLLYKAAAAEMDEKVSHYIIAIDPILGDRTEFTLKITTDYLMDQILTHLKKSDQHAAENLYRLFIQVPYTRASAGRILERAFLEIFPNGGEWSITAMEKRRAADKNTHWHFDVEAPCKILRLGFQPPIIQSHVPIVSVEDGRIGASGGSCGQVEQCYFPSEKLLTLERRFYIPQSPTQPSFDAFVYDPDQRRATMFQVTVAKQHSISIIGLDWLNMCGASTIDLVVVTSPLGKDDKMKIGVANSHEAKLENVYCLALA